MSLVPLPLLLEVSRFIRLVALSLIYFYDRENAKLCLQTVFAMVIFCKQKPRVARSEYEARIFFQKSFDNYFIPLDFDRSYSMAGRGPTKFKLIYFRDRIPNHKIYFVSQRAKVTIATVMFPRQITKRGRSSSTVYVIHDSHRNATFTCSLLKHGD